MFRGEIVKELCAVEELPRGEKAAAAPFASYNFVEGEKKMGRMQMDAKRFILQPTLSCSSSCTLIHLGGRLRWNQQHLKTSRYRPHFKQSLGDEWKKLGDIDKDAIQQRLKSWLVKAQTLWDEMTSPKSAERKSPVLSDVLNGNELQEVFTVEQTIHSKTPTGNLSLAAVFSVEQFSRLNGLSGRKVQKIFEALAPEPICSDARNLIEYCCFRYLSRDSSEVHPSLKEPAFQRLIFITMLAWEQPYEKENENSGFPKHISLQGKFVREEGFIRIAAAVPGVADRSTAHHLYKTLAGDKQGISLDLWTSFLSELLRVHHGRESYQSRENANLLVSDEYVLCVGSSQKKPVLKWDKNIGWPGKLILTDHALYFQEFGLIGKRRTLRLDLASHNVKLQKIKVGPLGFAIFDSAVSVSSGPNSENWVLEFVDLGGEMRRDVWHALINEVVSVHKFIHDYGPTDDDPSLHHVYGSHRGKFKAIKSAANNIARLQSLQFICRLSDDPMKLMQFSYLENAPGGDIVLQTLAVSTWGGPLTAKFVVANHQPTTRMQNFEDEENTGLHRFDIDGSVYLRKWMKSSSWSCTNSISFWKNASVREGIILGKNLVVGGKSLVERAASNCRERSQIVERTQATIDAAVLEGIPNNIDLLKEILLPLIIIGRSFDKLRHWEKPSQTILFLAFAYILVVRNLLTYVFPSIIMFIATTMLLLKGLKEQGRLGRYIGKITIREQPPSSTIEKFIAIKEALKDVEGYLQKLNVMLLKVRAIILASQSQVTNEVALILLFSATILYTVPFRYIFAFLLLDTFTRELEFRKEMVKKFVSLMKERWQSIPATPVIVLPYEINQSKNSESTIRLNDTREITYADVKEH